MAYYRLENIKKAFKENIIIENINFEIKKGEIVAFVGKSGVGKTTLFDILAGFENVTEGKIFLNEKDITNEKKYISYMMQKPLLLQHLTILQNICIPLKLDKVSKKKSEEIAINMLKKFELFEHKDKYPSELSGGMKQRVAFLRAYLKKGDIMLLDEPFSALDSITKHYIYNWFKNLIKKRENTIIFITHDIKEAIMLADKVFVLSGKPSSIVYSLNINEEEKNEENFLISPKFNSYYNQILEYIGEVK
ncbi:MAG: ABC transporter ATP-binding protein [Eubacteriales bacterium]|nr:ABC transporter ATP-binding protein [Eubacteriales bacterium]